MILRYVKKVDIPVLMDELDAANLGLLVSSVSQSGSVLTIITKASATDSTASAIRKVVEDHVPEDSSPLSQDQADALQQRLQREFGLQLLPELVDQIGAINLKLSRSGQGVDVASMASQMASIKLLLEGGALKTVRGICAQLKPAFPVYANVLEHGIVSITNFLHRNGWD